MILSKMSENAKRENTNANANANSNANANANTNANEEMQEVERKTFNIVSLINNNPLSRLNGNYQSKLINMIKNEFNSDGQQLFVGSFYSFLNYDEFDEYVIDLDDIWKWLNFSQKGKCKDLLTRYFTKDVDYMVEKPASAFTEAGSNRDLSFYQTVKSKTRGGSEKEKIFLNVHCFKKLCLKARTKKADEIHDYFIKLERIIHKLTIEESEELENQLRIKNDEIEVKDILLTDNEKNLIFNFNNKKVVYLILVEEGVYKFGYTKQIQTRMPRHRRDFGDHIKLVFIFESIYYIDIEDLIKKDEILSQKRFSKKYINNDSDKTELIKLDENFTIQDLTKKVEEIKLRVGDIQSLIKENEKLKLEIEVKDFKIKEFEKLKEENEKLTEENEKLTEENLDLKHVNEQIKDKIWMNPAEIKPRRPKYKEKIKEEISKKIESNDFEEKEKESKESNKTSVKKELNNGKDKRCNGKIVSRNLKTGEETVYDSLEQAAKYSGTSTNCLKKSLLDKPRQSNGCHWRKYGNKYWIPPANLVYNEGKYKASKNYVIAIRPNHDDFKVFESNTYAAEILNVAPRKLLDFQDKGRIHPETGYLWYKLPYTLIGYYRYSNLDSDRENSEFKMTPEWYLKEVLDTMNTKSDKQRIEDIFEYTGDINDKIHVSKIRDIFNKNHIGMNVRTAKPIFESWGAKYYDNKTKINVNGVNGVGYSGIKLIN